MVLVPKRPVEKESDAEPSLTTTTACKVCLDTLDSLSSTGSSLRPRVSVRFGKRYIPALVDTGADVSVISATLFQRLSETGHLEYWPKLLHRPSMQLRSATGNMVNVQGKTSMLLEVGGRIIQQEFLVVSGVKTDCILGADFLHHNQVVIDSGEKKLHWKTKNQEVNLDPIETPYLSMPSEVTIAPRTARKLKVTAQGMEGKLLTENWVFEPYVPYMVEALITPDPITTVLAYNPTDFPLTIQKGERLGNLEKYDDVKTLDSLTTQMRPDTKSKTHNLADLDLHDIPACYHTEYLNLIRAHNDVFSKHTYDVGSTNILPQDIILKDPNKIACQPPYRIPENLRPVAKEYIQNLAAAGIIQKSTSPFSSPLMLVKKGDAHPDKPLVDQYRVVHDYRRLNDNVVRDSYPMRNLYELLDSVAQAKVWSVIDLSSGFWNQNLNPKSRPYTAFGLPGMGHWEYTRSAQGLNNSPAAFQRLLDHVLEGLPGVYVYIDDVIVCSTDHQQHLELLDKVFLRFKKFNLKCKLSKLQLGAGEVNYLGYNVSREHGIRAGAAKIDVVRKWHPPTSVTEIKQFLGLCSFFRRTIPKFAETASPLTKLTRKDASWTSSILPHDAMEAFLNLKTALCSRPCLSPVNFTREFILTTDASAIGLGAILSQVGNDGEEHPCAYASRTLSAPEQKWAPTHLEHLAMCFGAKHFRAYLAGRHFTLRTDHKPLTSLNRLTGTALERLRAELEDFRPFTVEYIKGEIMPADGLSRMKAEELEARLLPAAVTQDQLYYLQKQDNEIKALVVWLKWKQEPQSPKLLEYVHRFRDIAILQRGIVFVQRKGIRLALAPQELRATLLYHSHDSPLAGHRSALRTLQKLQEFWYWPFMEAEVEAHCKGCRTCLVVNRPAHNRPGPMGKLKPVTHFNERVHIDLLGWLPPDSGSRYLLVMQDAHTKWIELAPLEDKTAENTVTALVTNWVNRHGAMEIIVSDQGKEFVNSVMSALCDKLHIGHQTTSAMHPQANGLVERSNRTILAYLRKFLEGSNDWVTLLPMLQFSLNTACHTSTGQTPFRLVYGRRPRVPLTLQDPDHHSKYKEDSMSVRLRAQATLQRDVAASEEAAWEEQKRRFDQNSREKPIKVGDVVYINRPQTGTQFRKFQVLYMGPYTVVELLHNDNLALLREDGKIVSLHKNRVKLAPFAQQLYGGTSGPGEASTTPNHATKIKEGQRLVDFSDGEQLTRTPRVRFALPAQPGRRRAEVPRTPDAGATPPTPPAPRGASSTGTWRKLAKGARGLADIISPRARTRSEVEKAGVILKPLWPAGRKTQERDFPPPPPLAEEEKESDESDQDDDVFK
jgi:hypothetical protein